MNAECLLNLTQNDMLATTVLACIFVISLTPGSKEGQNHAP